MQQSFTKAVCNRVTDAQERLAPVQSLVPLPLVCTSALNECVDSTKHPKKLVSSLDLKSYVAPSLFSRRRLCHLCPTLGRWWRHYGSCTALGRTRRRARRLHSCFVEALANCLYEIFESTSVLPPILDFVLFHELCCRQQAHKQPLENVQAHGIAELLPKLCLGHRNFEICWIHSLQTHHLRFRCAAPSARNPVTSSPTDCYAGAHVLPKNRAVWR